MIIKNIKTNQIENIKGIDSLLSPFLGRSFRNGDWKGLSENEITQYTTDKEGEFLLKEKQSAIDAKVKELTPKSITGTITQQEKDELKTMINN